MKHEAVRNVTGRLPLYFIENQGQLDDTVSYYVQGSDKTLYFTSEGLTFVTAGKGQIEQRDYCVNLIFKGATSGIEVQGLDKQEAVFSYFKGKRENWKTGVPTYATIAYRDLWPHIDLIYYLELDTVKYELHLKPGADLDDIRFEYDGISGLCIDSMGGLKVTTPAGEIIDNAPLAFQKVGQERVDVPVEYAVEDRFTLGFDVGNFDRDELLVIDPAFLVYCGYIGGAANDDCLDIAVDIDGNAYVTGWSMSPQRTFPLETGPSLTHGGKSDIFVAKVNAAGNALVYCGYIGGEDSDVGQGIAVDVAGNAYITGWTESDESTFPLVNWPYQTHQGYSDAFVAKVTAAGNQLSYCGFLGGGQYDEGHDIAVDAQGCAYIAGHTDHNGFPSVVGPDLIGSYYTDAFVAKVNAIGSGLHYCGFIGGKDDDMAFGIAVDEHGNAYVTGKTESDEHAQEFPVLVGPDLIFNGKDNYEEAFVAKVVAAGTHLDYCGYIGGDLRDYGYGIAVDQEGCAYVTGETETDEWDGFPVVHGPDLTFNGDYDAFVAKIEPSGASFVYCGYLGGDGGDSGRDIALDPAGNAYLTGYTRSHEWKFPVVGGPGLIYNGGGDIFTAKLDRSGTFLQYCGYIGGTEEDLGRAIALDGFDRAYIAGYTKSNALENFPVLVGPDLTFNGLGSTYQDGFVTKVAMALSSDSHTLSQQGGVVRFALHGGPDQANRYYLMLGSVSGTDPGHPLPGGQVTLPLNWDPFTDLVLLLLNTQVFFDFQGRLDAAGAGMAQLSAPDLPWSLVGVVIHFAYCVNMPFDFVSNPVGIEIVPY